MTAIIRLHNHGSGCDNKHTIHNNVFSINLLTKSVLRQAKTKNLLLCCTTYTVFTVTIQAVFIKLFKAIAHSINS